MTTYLTSYCNGHHRLTDGVPVEHACYVLPVEALEAERVGDLDRAQAVLEAWTARRAHKGARRPKENKGLDPVALAEHVLKDVDSHMVIERTQVNALERSFERMRETAKAASRSYQAVVDEREAAKKVIEAARGAVERRRCACELCTLCQLVGELDAVLGRAT